MEYILTRFAVARVGTGTDSQFGNECPKLNPTTSLW